MRKNKSVINKLIKKTLTLSKENKILVFLVGGFWRDKLLNRPVYDLDLVVSKNTKKFAQELSNLVNGSFVVLDKKNKIYRIVTNQENETYFLDIAQMQGKNIEQDLHRRDFTINAIASPLSLRPVIDPFNGIKDIQNKLIRKVSDNIFREDPLRLLRAFRFAAELGFKIDPKTLDLIKKQVKLIRLSAGERVRDEIFKILAINTAAKIIEQLDKVGLWDTLFPETVKMKKSARKFYFHPKGLWQHSWESLFWLEKICNDLSKYIHSFSRKIEKHLNQDTSQGITRKTLLKFVAIFHDIAKPCSAKRVENRMRFFGHEEKGGKILSEIMQRLRLSNREISIAKKLVSSHMRPGNLTQVKELTTRAVYRYFRDLGDEGVDLLILSLADRYSYIRISEKPQEIRNHCKKVNKILELYFREKKRVVPPKLVTGKEVMRICQIPEGPEVGKILRIVEEHQSTGEISTKDQARKFLYNLKS